MVLCIMMGFSTKLGTLSGSSCIAKNGSGSSLVIKFNISDLREFKVSIKLKGELNTFILVGSGSIKRFQ